MPATCAIHTNRTVDKFGDIVSEILAPSVKFPIFRFADVLPAKSHDPLPILLVNHAVVVSLPVAFAIAARAALHADS